VKRIAGPANSLRVVSFDSATKWGRPISTLA
jgi:hypothetical protein